MFWFAWTGRLARVSQLMLRDSGAMEWQERTEARTKMGQWRRQDCSQGARCF